MSVKFFHIGIRCDEIVAIGPNIAGNSVKFPTTYLLRNGERKVSTGEWWENISKVEQILSSQLAVSSSVDHRNWLEAQIKDAEERLAATRTALNSARESQSDDTALESIVKAILPVHRKERPNIHKHEVAEIVSALRKMGVTL